jgi:DMSO reductase anchor subunit
MNLMEKIAITKDMTIIILGILFVITLYGLLLTSIAFLTKNIFDNYENIECNGKIYQCKTMSKWAYVGIILNLIVYSILILSTSLNIIKINNDKDIANIIVLMVVLGISIIGLLGSIFTLKRSTLQCDDKYVCKDSDVKETFMKISSIISIILISIGIIGIFTFGISSIYEIIYEK